MAPVAGDRTLFVEGEAALPVAKALASEPRQMILSVLTHNVMNVSELADILGMPHSTVNFHLGQLRAAGLVAFEAEPGTRGTQKLCAKTYDLVTIRLPGAAVEADHENVVVVSMPIGSYRQLEATPTCGLVSETKIIGMLDDPRSFFEPDHVYAQLLWFRDGYVEYSFPNNLPYGAAATRMEISMELCSEAPQYDPNWPSDITLWINDVEIGTWTCPGDFGGQRAQLTPAWWHIEQTTFGLLKRWTVDSEGTMIDGAQLSGIQIPDLGIDSSNHVKLRLGVKPDARHRGGINLFGRKFGNYPQDIVMRTFYEFPGDRRRVTLR
jgi:predicted transcriptional regulator